MEKLQLVRQSSRLDGQLLGIASLPAAWRARFLAAKYSALWRLREGPARLDVAPLSMVLRDISGLGTLQSNIVDVHDQIVSTGILGPRPVVIDVGANIGQFVNAVKLFHPDARVTCFEPDPRSFADLVINTAHLDEVRGHNVGLGAEAAVRPFFRHQVSVVSSFSEMAEHRDGTQEVLHLEVRRLDEMVPGDVQPDLVKIDVEGFEREVLAGGWNTLRRSRFLLIELSLHRHDGRQNLKLLQEIAEHLPEASLLRFGRPLGDARRPDCQDVLIAVRRRD